MTIEFHCPRCDKLLKTADDKAGVQANCPECGEPVVVPVESDPNVRPAPVTTVRQLTAAFSREAGTKTCPMCGEQIVLAANRCRFCGEALRGHDLSGAWQPHRGGVILGLALGGLVVCLPCGLVCFPFGLICLPLGISAWVMANNDLDAIADGRMDPSGEGVTRAGKIVGIITCCLATCVVGLFAVFFFIGLFSNMR